MVPKHVAGVILAKLQGLARIELPHNIFKYHHVYIAEYTLCYQSCCVDRRTTYQCTPDTPGEWMLFTQE